MCSLEFPDLETNIHQQFASDGVVVIGIDAGGLYGGDTAKLVSQFVKQTGVTFPVGWDDNGSYRRLKLDNGISPFPLDVIIDRDGTIAYVAAEYDAQSMRAVIEGLVAATPPQ